MPRTIGRPGTARLAFYIGAIVLGMVVWAGEVYMQNRPQILGSSISELDPLQEKQLDAFLEMNRLLTTLGTTLLGALGFFLVSRRKPGSSPPDLWAAFASAICVGLSLYFGYRAYEDIIGMFQPPYRTFDLTATMISWDRYAHFYTFLLGVFFFADFALHQLSPEDEHEHSRSVASS
jgi:hypothetical protein